MESISELVVIEGHRRIRQLYRPTSLIASFYSQSSNRSVQGVQLLVVGVLSAFGGCSVFYSYSEEGESKYAEYPGSQNTTNQ